MPIISDLMQQCGVAFGTSGARGEVTAMTDRVCHAYTTGFLQYLTELGEFAPGSPVALAGDLRSSTPRILAACLAAIRDLGGVPEFCGYVPTPALALHAFTRSMPSIMVTGSHIPDDRNGIKFYRPIGEVLKSDESGMSRQQVIIDETAFDAQGMLINRPDLPVPVDTETAYIARYVDYFGPTALQGLRIGVYQHSAVGRDILTRLVDALGGEATPLARATAFIPVDTEAIRPEDVTLAEQWSAQHQFDAIISTDGDSDRPLLADHNGQWLRGDVLGVLCAQAIRAKAVVTPVSSNTALEKCGSFARTARTRIGSPYVIDAMNAALAEGAERVCGYEANGGFLLASPIEHNDKVLAPLPTRDAVLPIVAVLAAAKPGKLTDLVANLPARFTHSDRIQGKPTAESQVLLQWLQADSQRISHHLGAITASKLATTDTTDGLRMTFANEDVIHLRPSGNAPELRCYSESNNMERARTLCMAVLDWAQGVRPD